MELRQNDIKDSGVQALAQILTIHPALRHLGLISSNMTPQGISYLAEAVRAITHKHVTADLLSVDEFPALDFSALTSAFEHQNKHMQARDIAKAQGKAISKHCPIASVSSIIAD